MTLDKACPTKRGKTGAILGGLAGALAGGLAGKSVAGALIGGLAGAGLGYAIGKHWDKKACEKSRAALALALQTGQTQRWEKDGGGQSFTYAMENEHYGTATVARDIHVVEGRDLQFDGIGEGSGVYTVSSAKLNVRDRPAVTKQSRVLDSYGRGEKLLVMGKSEDNNWLLVSRGGAGAEGWVSAKSLTAATDDPSKFAVTGSTGTTVKTVNYRPLCMTGREIFEVDGKTADGEVKERCHNAKGEFV